MKFMIVDTILEAFSAQTFASSSLYLYKGLGKVSVSHNH